MIIFGLFFGLVFLPVILSIFGPAEFHSHSTTEYQVTPTNNNNRRKRHPNHPDGFNSNDKEMISFIQPNGNAESDEITQKDTQ